MHVKEQIGIHAFNDNYNVNDILRALIHIFLKNLSTYRNLAIAMKLASSKI